MVQICSVSRAQKERRRNDDDADFLSFLPEAKLKKEAKSR